MELGRTAAVLHQGGPTLMSPFHNLTFLQSETYTPVYSEEIARQYSINYDPAVHGISGPVQVSYPKYFYPQSGMWSKIMTKPYRLTLVTSESFRRFKLPWCSDRV